MQRVCKGSQRGYDIRQHPDYDLQLGVVSLCHVKSCRAPHTRCALQHCAGDDAGIEVSAQCSHAALQGDPGCERYHSVDKDL